VYRTVLLWAKLSLHARDKLSSLSGSAKGTVREREEPDLGIDWAASDAQQYGIVGAPLSVATGLLQGGENVECLVSGDLFVDLVLELSRQA
jgi:hypothetical protein